jgi:N-acetylmuramoyl-L-alanine amidase
MHYSGMNADEQRDHRNCAARVRAIQRFHMRDRGWLDIAYCADEETEALTKRGFLPYMELTDRDEVLTLDHGRGLAEWQPLLAVNVFEDERPRRMILMEGASHSSLTTPDHRWPVERYVRRFRTKLLDRTTGKRSRTKLSAERVPMFATTETLRYFDRVPAAAPCASVPRKAQFTDDYVELLTWFWTEGHIRLSRGKPTSGVAIYQSHEANPAYVDRIRSCLTSLFGPSVPALSKQGDTVPRWREGTNGQKTEFFLNHVAGVRLLSDAPDKVVLPSFIAALTPRQIKLFIDTAVAADGSTAPSGHRSVAQKDPRRLEGLQMACALLGIRTNLTSVGGRFPPAARKLSIFRGRPFLWPRAGEASTRRFVRRPVEHSGVVWCPTTANGTWFARRRGTTYFTGNSHLVCRHGYVFVGRGFGARSAANGTAPANDHYFAICFLGDDSVGRADVTPEARQALEQLIAEYRRRYPRARQVRPHSDFVATLCPGDELRALISRL